MGNMMHQFRAPGPGLQNEKPGSIELKPGPVLVGLKPEAESLKPYAQPDPRSGVKPLR